MQPPKTLKGRRTLGPAAFFTLTCCIWLAREIKRNNNLFFRPRRSLALILWIQKEKTPGKDKSQGGKGLNPFPGALSDRRRNREDSGAFTSSARSDNQIQIYMPTFCTLEPHAKRKSVFDSTAIGKLIADIQLLCFCLEANGAHPCCR